MRESARVTSRRDAAIVRPSGVPVKTGDGVEKSGKVGADEGLAVLCASSALELVHCACSSAGPSARISYRGRMACVLFGLIVE